MSTENGVRRGNKREACWWVKGALGTPVGPLWATVDADDYGVWTALHPLRIACLKLDS